MGLVGVSLPRKKRPPGSSNNGYGAEVDDSATRLIAQLPRRNKGFGLTPPTLDPLRLEVALEAELRRRIATRRNEDLDTSRETVLPALLQCPTRTPPRFTHGSHGSCAAWDQSWDEELCYYMEPPLAAYENQQITGASFGNEDFQVIVRSSWRLHHSDDSPCHCPALDGAGLPQAFSAGAPPVQRLSDMFWDV